MPDMTHDDETPPLPGITDITAHIAAEVLHVFGRGGYRPGDFREALYHTIGKADPQNKARLAQAFPAEVTAFRLGQEYEVGIAMLRKIVGDEWEATDDGR